MQLKAPVSILVAPLDWGLGHATRCIPIIRELVEQKARVIIAASGHQKALLKLEFPQLEFLEIPAYGITYKHGVLLKWALMLSIPSILSKIRRENRWLAETLRSHQIDAVISDNRYGLFNKNIYSVFVTHQLAIQSGLAKHKMVDGVRLMVDGLIARKLMKWNYRFIEKFSACWVPDQCDDFSLAGKLSNPPHLPNVPTKYIGILSRFRFKGHTIRNDQLLILISGPEPQRTDFEKLLLAQLADCAMKVLLVRGLPDSSEEIYLSENVRIRNHIPSDELNTLLNESTFIIARAGYTTIMDLVKLRRSAVLVPTPGQPEQEYLGRYLQEKKWMYCVEENKFNLNKVLGDFKESGYEYTSLPEVSLAETVSDFLRSFSGSKG